MHHDSELITEKYLEGQSIESFARLVGFPVSVVEQLLLEWLQNGKLDELYKQYQEQTNQHQQQSTKVNN